MRYIVYDLEILKAIPPRIGDRLAGIDYCEGWDDHANMGISVLCAMTESDSPRVFLGDEQDALEQFALMCEGRTVVGFNSRRFDDAVLEANGITTVQTTIDLLDEVRRASGQPVEYVQGVTRSGYNLDAMCRENLGERKTSTGSQAPIDWQRGLKSEVISYCLRDVMLTQRLLELWLARKWLIDPTNGERLTLDECSDAMHQLAYDYVIA